MTTATLPTRNKVRDSDTELIRAIVAGKPELFAELVRRYERMLLNFSRRVCRAEADAADLVQETFLNAYRYLGEFRFETQFRNWLYRIAVSLCGKRHRRSKFAPERELPLDTFEPDEAGGIADEMPEWAKAPLDRLLNEELSAKLNEAVLSLPENYRLAFILRDVEGFSTEESAQILGLSAANVKVRLHRARTLLRSRLESYCAR